MPQLRRSAPKLLGTVRGQPHASSEDHEEPLPQPYQPSPRTIAQEEDINAEPISSDDEIRAPPPRTEPSKSKIPAVQPSDASEDLKIPQRKLKSTRPSLRVPRSGSFQQSQLEKALRKPDDNKENACRLPSSSMGSESNAWGFDAELAEPPPKKKQKTTFGSKSKEAATVNIHAPSIANGAKKSARKFGGKGVKMKDDEMGRLDTLNSEEEEELFSKGRASPDAELRQWKPKTKQKTLKDNDLKQPTLSEAELDECLADSSQDKPTKRSSRLSKTALLVNQLGDWNQGPTPASSQPTSSAPLENIDDYLDQLPEEEAEDSRCHICKAHVSSDEYWSFWKGQDKTIKKQNEFCHVHRKNAALAEHKTEGYPTINWSTLPSRIRKHRMELYKILTADSPSPFRHRYEPLALTGKAAAIPRIRKDLPLDVQQDLSDAALDDHSIYPGYYGPRGRRIMTEAVMKLFKNEIKNCADPVVQASGPAAFIQAVLVPETALLLIMEDCKCDAVAAEEIRESTYEMGCLLHEELEDRVEGGSASEDENEYGAS